MTKRGIVGQVLDGKYNIEKQLGEGGMGTVYLATHIGTGRPVAVKVIVPEYMERAEFVERFRREARAAGRLRHPNVVDVTDFGFAVSEDNENVAYLVMEYLDGCTLGEVLEEEKQLPLSFSIEILEQVCSAVSEAHNEGIIHRDLKPDNIWLEPNQRGGYTVKVLDFGIAKLEELTDLELDKEKTESTGDESVGHSERQTVIEDSGSDTIVDKKTPTLVPESETVELSEDPKTGLLKDTPVDSEGGTVLLPSGETKLIEPEIGKATRLIDRPVETDKSRLGVPSTAELTRAGAVLGTPLYMSPEQCRGEKLSTRSDIYSLAVIVYQMLSGSPPFEGDYRAVMDGHKSLDPPPLVANNTPKKLRKIVMESLAKDPADRPETAEAFASKVRGSSEGLGVLLRRAVVIYSERLPKLLQLTILTFLPLIALNVLKGGFGLAVGFGFVNDEYQLITVGFEVVHFFLSIVTSAFLVGMMTWVVAHYLAYPLRPMSLGPAFKEVRTRARSLSLTVGLSTIIAFIGYAFCLLPGVWLSARFMLIAPSIMMEGITGRAAFRRSIELTKRSFRTVFATALLVYVIPVTAGLIIGIFIALANTAYVQSLRVSKMNEEIKTMKEQGVNAEPQADKKKDSDESVKVEFGSKRIEVFTSGDAKINDDHETEVKVKKFGAVSQVVSQAVLILLMVVMASFTSVITALLYFKTRQSGGESMQGLLGKLDDADRPQTKWQQRVRERLIQSGKITRTPSGS